MWVSKWKYEITVTEKYHVYLTADSISEVQVRFSTKIIKIVTFSDRNRKAIEKLCGTILKGAIL